MTPSKRKGRMRANLRKGKSAHCWRGHGYPWSGAARKARWAFWRTAAENRAKETIKICGSETQVCIEACQCEKLEDEREIRNVSGGQHNADTAR